MHHQVNLPKAKVLPALVIVPAVQLGSCRKADNIVLFEFNPPVVGLLYSADVRFIFEGTLHDRFHKFGFFLVENYVLSIEIAKILNKISDSETKLKTLLETIARLQEKKTKTYVSIH